MALMHEQRSRSQSSNCPPSPVSQIMVFLLWSLRNHFRLLICRARWSPPAGIHLGVLCWRRRATRWVPAALASPLIDVKPATIRGVPFRYPARRKIVIGAGRRRALKRGGGTVEGTFTCALIDAGSESVSHDSESVSSLQRCGE